MGHCPDCSASSGGHRKNQKVIFESLCYRPVASGGPGRLMHRSITEALSFVIARSFLTLSRPTMPIIDLDFLKVCVYEVVFKSEKAFERYRHGGLVT